MSQPSSLHVNPKRLRRSKVEWTPTNCGTFVDLYFHDMPNSLDGSKIHDALKHTKDACYMRDLGWLKFVSGEANNLASSANIYDYGPRYLACEQYGANCWKYHMTEEEVRAVEQKATELIQAAKGGLKKDVERIPFHLDRLIILFPGILDWDDAATMMKQPKFGLSYHQEGANVVKFWISKEPTDVGLGGSTSQITTPTVPPMNYWKNRAEIKEKGVEKTVEVKVEPVKEEEVVVDEDQSVKVTFCFDRPGIARHFSHFATDVNLNDVLTRYWFQKWDPMETWCALELMEHLDPSALHLVFNTFQDASLCGHSWRLLPVSVSEKLNPFVVMQTIHQLKNMLYPIR